jgi:phage tail-like protein
MSCGGAKQTFRLLDAIVGWDRGPDPGDAKGLTGFDDSSGVTLQPSDPGAVSAIAPYLPPPWLAQGCGACEWYLATRRGAIVNGQAGFSRLLRLERCACAWEPVWRDDCTAVADADITAIAVAGHRLAIADCSTASITLYDDSRRRVQGTVACSSVVAMSFGPSGSLLVATENAPMLLRFGVAGEALAPWPATLPEPAAHIAALGVGSDGTVWLATPGKESRTYRLWRACAGDTTFVAGTLAELAAARPASRLRDATDGAFCIGRTGNDGGEVPCCYTRCGEPLAPGSFPPPVTPSYEPQGQLLTDAIDSGVPRCVWHRVQVDADIPAGTALSIAVASADVANAAAQGQSDWPGFPGGVPHNVDWQETISGTTDFLIQQPPGRYLYVRMRLQSSDGKQTPRVRRLRIDFPRVTSLDQLPAIYRENADAADFTERFLGLFDASIADLDAAIARAPALLDAGGVPDDVVPWLASFLGLALDPAWEPARQRATLQAIPELYRLRGTLAGLKMAFKLIFDVEPAIEELALQRPWAALGSTSRVANFRLFGRTRARATLGRSALGATTVKSFGDPARDPLDAVAYRFRVLVPPPAAGRFSPARIRGLVESQKPAHTVATVRLGGAGFLVGASSAIGIDTALTPLAAPVLGSAGNVRLNSATVLRRGRRRRQRPYSLAVGLQPLTE